MQCETCENIEDVDGVRRPCKTEKGCMIPKLTPAAARLMEMRSMIIALPDVAETALRMYGASLEEMKMLANVELALREKKNA